MQRLDDFLEREKYQHFKYYMQQSTQVGSRMIDDLVYHDESKKDDGTAGQDGTGDSGKKNKAGSIEA